MTLESIVLGSAFISMLIWFYVREEQHQRIVRDLTAKIIAKNLDDYKQVAECLPRLKLVKKVEEKKKVIDDVLGGTY